MSQDEPVRPGNIIRSPPAIKKETYKVDTKNSKQVEPPTIECIEIFSQENPEINLNAHLIWQQKIQNFLDPLQTSERITIILGSTKKKNLI